jgi:hypothetical protein
VICVEELSSATVVTEFHMSVRTKYEYTRARMVRFSFPRL